MLKLKNSYKIKKCWLIKYRNIQILKIQKYTNIIQTIILNNVDRRIMLAYKLS